VTGVPSLGVATPYGGSFWAPFQYGLEYGLNSTYLSPYFTGVPYIGWPLGSRSRFIQPNPVYIPSTRVGSPAYRTTHIQPVVPYTAPRPVYSPPRSIYTPSSTRMAMPVPRGGAARPAGRR
ncbi:MAG TPA: hypothetical protein VFW83_01160, partial [Bryobacteraceae bacterium]|nr:hypothetical protein [Bryobacteraceae bacterium]